MLREQQGPYLARLFWTWRTAVLADTGCLLDTREWMKEQRNVRSLSVQLVLETPSLELHDPVLILEKH